MLRVVAFCLTVACCAVSSQPVVCGNDDQCAEKYYCETSTHRCLECLQCSDLKRKPPLNSEPTSCVKSLIQCGPCLEGFVVDLRGDVNAQCISADSVQDSPILPPFVWALIAVAILIIVGVGVLYLYRSSGNIKVWVSTSIRSMFDRPSEGRSGEDLPPPYNPNYNYVHTTNPSYVPQADWNPVSNEEPSRPFIKRALPTDRQDARESSGYQEARVFNRPVYEDQEDDPLSSPEATEDELTEDLHNNNFHRHDKNSPNSWMPQDEETVASTWTPYEEDNSPNTATNNNTSNIHANNFHFNGDATDDVHSRRRVVPSADASAEVDGAGALVSPPDAAPGPSAAKRSCVRQDSNNRICDSGASSAENSTSAANQQPSTSHNQILTVIANINIGNNLINNSK